MLPSARVKDRTITYVGRVHFPTHIETALEEIINHLTLKLNRAMFLVIISYDHSLSLKMDHP